MDGCMTMENTLHLIAMLPMEILVSAYVQWLSQPVMFLSLTGLQLHNHYPLLYQQAAFDFFTSLDPDPDDAYAPDYVYYVRSGYLGSQNVTWAHWTGDPSSDW